MGWWGATRKQIKGERWPEKQVGVATYLTRTDLKRFGVIGPRHDACRDRLRRVARCHENSRTVAKVDRRVSRYISPACETYHRECRDLSSTSRKRSRRVTTCHDTSRHIWTNHPTARDVTARVVATVATCRDESSDSTHHIAWFVCRWLRGSHSAPDVTHNRYNSRPQHTPNPGPYPHRRATCRVADRTPLT